MARFVDRPPGRPFGDDYDRGFSRAPRVARAAPSPLHPSSLSAYVEAVRPTLRPDADTLDDVREQRAAVIDRLRTGWERRGEHPLEVVRNVRDADVFPVQGELLATPEAWQELQQDPLAAGITQVPLGHPELSGRLVRLQRTADADAPHLHDLVQGWREQGIVVSLSYVTPLAGRPIMKPFTGEFEPEVVDFASYRTVGPRHGEGTVVAVVDTGIAEEVRGDGWLASIPRVTVDDLSTHWHDANVDPLDADPQDGLLDVFAGHGTFVAGIVARVAPGAEIRVYRAVGPGGAGSELDVACAVVRAVREGADVVNLSLGTQTLFDEPSLAMSVALDLVADVEEETGRRVVLVAAAGNYGDEGRTWPAAFGRVVAVGGLTAELRPSTWSSRGPWVDLSTVGEGIVSTYVQGVRNPAFGRETHFGPDAFASWVGTSFAAPQVSGAVARTMTELGVTGPEAVRALLAAGRPVAGFGKALRILPGA